MCFETFTGCYLAASVPKVDFPFAATPREVGFGLSGCGHRNTLHLGEGLNVDDG